MKYILTCIAGVESITKKEIERVWWKIIEVKDRAIEFEGDLSIMIKINLWSRVANKVYIVLDEGKNIDNFDKLYDLVNTIDFKKYRKDDFPIVVKAKSIKSQLTSTPAIQKVCKKAIIDSLIGKSSKEIFEANLLERLEVNILIQEDNAKVLLNTSWLALHMRWYRTNAWDAPIKESLAAAIVLLSGWKFKEEFYDFFCWSGTIAIEAAMIAKNIAPWLKRDFAFEKLGIVKKEDIEKEKKEARKKVFEWEYKIKASDIDFEMIEISKENAKNAWVYEMIDFQQKSFEEYLEDNIKWSFVSNPPYWDRMNPENLRSIYNNIDKLFRINPELKWWIISSYSEFSNLVKKDSYKNRKLYNGWELCYFYKRK